MPGEDNSSKTRDKARFIAGLYLALNGQVEMSRSEMSLIISDPVTPTSPWITPAREFLDAFNNLNELPNACIAVKICEDFLHLDEIIRTLKASDPQAAVDFINQIGVESLNSGSFDTNNDGQLDPWIMTNNGTSNLIIWLFIKDKGTIQSFSLGNLSTPSPVTFHSQRPFMGYPVFSLESGQGTQTFILDRDPLSGEVQLSWLCDHLGTDLDHLQTDLMAGSPRTKIIQALSEIGSSLDAACSYPYDETGYARPRWQYLLGLTYEMAGNPTRAAENYLAVWQSYPGSPYAIMAHSKLVHVSP